MKHSRFKYLYGLADKFFIIFFKSYDCKLLIITLCLQLVGNYNVCLQVLVVIFSKFKIMKLVFLPIYLVQIIILN